MRMPEHIFMRIYPHRIGTSIDRSTWRCGLERWVASVDMSTCMYTRVKVYGVGVGVGVRVGFGVGLGVDGSTVGGRVDGTVGAIDG